MLSKRLSHDRLQHTVKPLDNGAQLLGIDVSSHYGEVGVEGDFLTRFKYVLKKIKCSVLVKRPQPRRARRNGCFRRLVLFKLHKKELYSNLILKDLNDLRD